MHETIREKIARQIELENESRALGASRYQSKRPLPWRTETSSVEEEADLPPGRRLLKVAVQPAAEALREWCDLIANGGAGRRPEAYAILSMIGAEEAAYLTGRVILSSAAAQATRTQAAYEIGQAFADHIEMAALKRSNRAGFEGLAKLQQNRGASSKKRRAIRDIMDREGVKTDFPKMVRIAAGQTALELFCEATGLFVTDTVASARGTTKVIRATESIRKWLEQQHARCELLDPIHLPMIVRPRRWRSPFVGGYLTKRPGQRLVKQWSHSYHEELRHVDMPGVYAAINAVQDTPWRINRRVLSVMREVWDGGGNLGGLPRRDNEVLPPKPDDIGANEVALKTWKREAALVHRSNSQTLSKRLAFTQRLWVAERFADEEAIYFPHELDFRGRMYPTPTGGPHPHGDDAAKALLEFADGVPLGEWGHEWLAVHVANLFGRDKASFDERIQWVRDNEARILDSARDPLDGERFWTTAESPYCALAACMEWAGYVEQGAAWVSHISVALDGSNSGLQHFSAMLRDPVGAKAVNLLPCERPQDIYAEVAQRAQAMADASEEAAAHAWKDGRVTRKIAKRPAMTFVYSSTRFGMQEMVSQTLREIDADNAEQGKPRHLGEANRFEAANWLSHALWSAISGTVVAASTAMEWLRAAARIASKANLPIWWTSPAGLPVLQMYRKRETKRAEVFVGGKRLRFNLSEEGDQIDTRRQTNGIAPNFIHSCDASHLMAVVNRATEHGINALAVVHDSFGTHAANAGRLSEILRDTFVEQYSEDVLARFRDELAGQLPAGLAAELPPLPAYGDLDLRALAGANYMFA